MRLPVLQSLSPLLLLLLLDPCHGSSSSPSRPATPSTSTSQLILLLPSHLPGPHHRSTTATLTASHQATRTAPLLRSGRFIFRNLTADSSYLLSVHSPDYVFAPHRVDVVRRPAADGAVGVRVYRAFVGSAWDDRGEMKGQSGGDGNAADGKNVEVVLEVLGRKEYYISPLSLLRNPMILLAVVAMGVVFGMPYLLENMDPEMRKEFEEQQRSSALTNAASGNPLQGFDMAAWMAGRPATGSGVASSATGSGSGSGNAAAPIAAPREEGKASKRR
ncbi:MAG: hypothetical protein M1826_003960 [Phylliscum demangeonii]|nr:MAG: hypothetical protein M1826_003960 [Phylliscum demangeonii]